MSDLTDLADQLEAALPDILTLLADARVALLATFPDGIPENEYSTQPAVDYRQLWDVVHTLHEAIDDGHPNSNAVIDAHRVELAYTTALTGPDGPGTVIGPSNRRGTNQHRARAAHRVFWGGTPLDFK